MQGIFDVRAKPEILLFEAPPSGLVNLQSGPELTF
jgi:hypothetical protein